MKVMLVAPGLHDYGVSLADSLAKRDLEVILLTNERRATLRPTEEVRVIPLFRFLPTSVNRGWFRKLGIGKVINSGLVIVGIVRLAVLCKRERPDLVHLHGILRVEPFALAGLLTLRLSRQVVVFTPHILGPRHRMPGAGLAWRLILKLTSHIIVHSDKAADTIVDKYRIGRGNLTVIPHGDYRVLVTSNPPVPRATARARVQLPPLAAVVLFLGRIEAYKGLDLLISAMPRVAKSVPNALLVIAGRTSGDFATYASQIGTLGISSRVTTRLGWVSESALADYLGACDVVAIPYRDLPEVDQSGIVQLASSYGRPVVATRVGGIPEQVIPGETGLLVPAGDESALVEAIVELLLNTEVRDKMAKRASSIGQERFSWSDIAAKTEGVYRIALENASTGQPV